MTGKEKKSGVIVIADEPIVWVNSITIVLKKMPKVEVDLFGPQLP